MFFNPPTPGSTGKMLFAGVHPAQQTDDVNVLLRRCNIKLKNIPCGPTSHIQVLDVVIKTLDRSGDDIVANSPAFCGRLTHFEEELQVENVFLQDPYKIKEI